MLARRDQKMILTWDRDPSIVTARGGGKSYGVRRIRGRSVEAQHETSPLPTLLLGRFSLPGSSRRQILTGGRFLPKG